VDLTIQNWPKSLAPKVVRRKRIHTVNMGPETIAGPPQSVVSDAGRWELEYSGVEIYGDRLLTFRAIVADITAPLKPIYVPVRDYRHTPRTRAGMAQFGAAAPNIPYSDTAVHSDGTPFDMSLNDFSLTNAVLERQSTFTITRNGPSTVILTAGNYIGIDDRAYIVKRIFPSNSNPDQFEISIWPYLRADHAAGTVLNTENPIIRCTMDPKQLEMFDNLDYDFLGQVDISFVEARW
jgi:hypothetical protein